MVNSKHASPVRQREKIAWLLVILQSILLFAFLSPSSDCDVEHNRQYGRRLDAVAATNGDAAATTSLVMNDRPNEYYDRKKRINSPGSSSGGTPAGKEASYGTSAVHDPESPAFVSRIWRSNGSPSVHPDLKRGTCWCSADEWCSCTPSLAIDLILRSGEDHVWLVRRSDTGLLALMGGFTEVGETSEETVHRELMEEMGVRLEGPPVLFGVYNDPRRDSRRHTSSVVYVADVGAAFTPKAGDDAAEVIRLPIAELDEHDFFVDHKTILHDYVEMVKRKKSDSLLAESALGGSEPFKRSVCPV